MPNFTYDSFKSHLFSGTIDFVSDTMMVALMTSSYTPSQAHTGWSQISANEIAGATASGYSATALSGKTVTVSSNVSIFDADNVTWDPSTITASGAVIYESGAERLVAYVDFGSDQSSSNGAFTIQWATDGILRIADA